MTPMQQMPTSIAYFQLCAKLHGESLNYQVVQTNNEKFIGNTPKMLDIIFMIGRFSKHKKPLLITGETGTGRTLVAKIIHNKSFRHAQPFIYMNFTSSQSTNNIEHFGFKDEITSALIETIEGKLGSVDKGTIFFEEVSELGPKMQEILFRFLKKGKKRQVDSSNSIYPDVRVIAATSKNLSAAVASGTFRCDLYYLLNTFKIEIPPLRCRKADIPLLTRFYLKFFYTQMCMKPKRISQSALDLLLSYEWPGNVSELRNVVERAMILGGEDILTPKDFPEYIKRNKEYFVTLKEMEKQHIVAALNEAGGNKTKAASLLDIGRATLYEKLKNYRIDSSHVIEL